MTSGAGPIFTIGHSTRTIEDFIALLHREDVRHLVDVRRFPVSRRYPHFDSRPLAASLAERGIGYEHAIALGGRRSALPNSRNLGWRNTSFRGYADHTATQEFKTALDHIVAVGASTPTVVMCAEAVPWRCHRTLIADALLARGCVVRHILDATTMTHTLTSFGVIVDGRVEYPGPLGDDLFSATAAE